MSACLLVTFVGGPRHGQQESFEDPEAVLWMPTRDGHIVAYGMRHSDACHAFYAPVGMSEDAYNELLRSLAALPANL